MKINDLPDDYLKDYRYIVAIECDGEYWYYGAFNNEDRAYNVALMVDGIVNKNF